jgi:pimeloyl-ACP methyl ester carboxylesterase
MRGEWNTCAFTGRSALLLVSLMMFCNAGCATVYTSSLANQIAHDPELAENVSVIFVEATPDLGNWGKLPQISGYFHQHSVETFYFDPDVHGDAQALAGWIHHEKVIRGRRVIVVGWSYGLVHALDALKCLESQNVSVDTLVSIDCFWLNYHRGDQVQPANTERVVLIYRDSAALPTGFSHPVVYRVDTLNHLAVPGHRKTMHVLFRETMRLRQCETCFRDSSIHAAPAADGT